MFPALVDELSRLTKMKMQLTRCGSKTLEPALAAKSNNVETISQVEGKGRLQGNKKATKINVSSPFSLCSLNGSDGHRSRSGSNMIIFISPFKLSKAA